MIITNLESAYYSIDDTSDINGLGSDLPEAGKATVGLRSGHNIIPELV